MVAGADGHNIVGDALGEIPLHAHLPHDSTGARDHLREKQEEHRAREGDDEQRIGKRGVEGLLESDHAGGMAQQDAKDAGQPDTGCLARANRAGKERWQGVAAVAKCIVKRGAALEVDADLFQDSLEAGGGHVGGEGLERGHEGQLALSDAEQLLDKHLQLRPGELPCARRAGELGHDGLDAIDGVAPLLKPQGGLMDGVRLDVIVDGGAVWRGGAIVKLWHVAVLPNPSSNGRSRRK